MTKIIIINLRYLVVKIKLNNSILINNKNYPIKKQKNKKWFSKKCRKCLAAILYL